MKKEMDPNEDRGFASFLPVFAGDEVQILSAQVSQMEKALRNAEEEMEEQEERANMMEEHAKRLEQENFQTQYRVDAKRREIATEEHINKLTEMEISRVHHDMKKVEKEIEETMIQMRSLNTSLFKAKEKMDNFQNVLQWNQEELEQWVKASKQKEEDTFALQTYTKSDNAKLKEIYLEAEKVSTELCALEQALDAEASATQSAQIELNKTAEVFRDMHNERKNLVRLWEDAVETIHKRDESIHKAAEEFAGRKSRLRECKYALDELAEQLQKEIQLQSELERRLKRKEEEIAEIYVTHEKEVACMKEAEDDLASLKGSLHHATVQFTAISTKKGQVEEELNIKVGKLERVTKKLTETKRKVNEELSLLDTLEGKRLELEKMLSNEEDALKSSRKEVAAIRERHYQVSEKLKILCDEEKETIHEIKGANSQSKSLTLKIHELEANLWKQEEVLYAADFQIQCLERKVAKASGGTNDFETKELQAKIAVLEREIEEKKSEESMVHSQIKRTEEDARFAKRKKEELKKRLTQFEEKNTELMLESETRLSSVKNLVKEKEEKMLSRDLLQLEVNKLQDIFNIKTDAIFGMEDARKRLEMCMDNRKVEIELRVERLRKELKSIQEDLHNLMLKKKKLYLHCEKLQGKYEVLLKRIKLDEDQERSPQYYMRKAAQESESIQREGYQLEKQLQQVQFDIKALDQAIEDIKRANDNLRHSHKSSKCIKIVQQELQIKEDLEHAVEQLEEKKALEHTILNELAEAEAQLENRKKENSYVSEMLEDLEEKVKIAAKEAEEQHQKYKRAEAQLDKLEKELKNAFGEESERFSKEMQLVELRETVQDILYKMKALADENPELTQKIEDEVNEIGLKLPSRSSSTRSSRSSKSSHGSSSAHSSARGTLLSSKGSGRSNRSSGVASQRSGSVVNLEFQGEV